MVILFLTNDPREEVMMSMLSVLRQLLKADNLVIVKRGTLLKHLAVEERDSDSDNELNEQ